MKFSDSQKESAVIGYIGTQGFTSIPASCHANPAAFTDPRWRIVYGAALALHRAGRDANHLTIEEEIDRLGWKAELEKETGGISWLALADSSLAFNASGIIQCLKDIGTYAAEREASTVGKELHDGTISAQEARHRLESIGEASHTINLDAILTVRSFDSKNPPAPARAIYEMNRHKVCTPGNLTAICAKAKVGKSALVGGFIAAAFGMDGDTLGIDSVNLDHHAVIHFDTEQSPADHHLLVATALFRVRLMEHPAWLKSYRVADIAMKQRFDLLEHALRQARKDHGGVHSVILDGVADFISDPNDPAEAFSAVERLHRLAVTHDTAIISVLHINPGSETNKTRGHLGSQLERKAETNLTLKKDDGGISTVFSTVSRHAHIPEQDGPRFKWDETAMMHVSCSSSRAETAQENNSRLRSIVGDVFADGGLKYTAAIAAVAKGAGVGTKRAEALFSDMKKASLIAQDSTGYWGVKQ